MIVYSLVLRASTLLRYQRIYWFAGDFVYPNLKNTSKNYAVCDRMAVLLLIRSLQISSLVLVSLFLMYCVPLYKILILKENDMVVPILVPFVDPETTFGFLVNLLNQLTFCFYGVHAMFGIELVTCEVKNTFSVSAAVIKNDLEMFADGFKGCKEFSIRFDGQFKNILIKILDFDR